MKELWFPTWVEMRVVDRRTDAVELKSSRVGRWRFKRLKVAVTLKVVVRGVGRLELVTAVLVVAWSGIKIASTPSQNNKFRTFPWKCRRHKSFIHSLIHSVTQSLLSDSNEPVVPQEGRWFILKMFLDVWSGIPNILIIKPLLRRRRWVRKTWLVIPQIQR